jgi:hypothetical protein
MNIHPILPKSEQESAARSHLSRDFGFEGRSETSRNKFPIIRSSNQTIKLKPDLSSHEFQESNYFLQDLRKNYRTLRLCA